LVAVTPGMMPPAENEGSKEEEARTTVVCFQKRGSGKT
jgi:hypothetical protein